MNHFQCFCMLFRFLQMIFCCIPNSGSCHPLRRFKSLIHHRCTASTRAGFPDIIIANYWWFLIPLPPFRANPRRDAVVRSLIYRHFSQNSPQLIPTTWNWPPTRKRKKRPKALTEMQNIATAALAWRATTRWNASCLLVGTLGVYLSHLCPVSIAPGKRVNDHGMSFPAARWSFSFLVFHDVQALRLFLDCLDLFFAFWLPCAAGWVSGRAGAYIQACLSIHWFSSFDCTGYALTLEVTLAYCFIF